MSAHTPGPWHFRPLFGRDTFAIFFPDGSMNRRVDDKAGGFNEPDAHLIAAAPDLLEALLVLFEEADNFCVSGVYFNEKCMGHRGLDLARAAITKATGEQA